MTDGRHAISSELADALGYDHGRSHERDLHGRFRIVQQPVPQDSARMHPRSALRAPVSARGSVEPRAVSSASRIADRRLGKSLITRPPTRRVRDSAPLVSLPASTSRRSDLSGAVAHHSSPLMFLDRKPSTSSRSSSSALPLGSRRCSTGLPPLTRARRVIIACESAGGPRKSSRRHRDRRPKHSRTSPLFFPDTRTPRPHSQSRSLHSRRRAYVYRRIG